MESGRATPPAAASSPWQVAARVALATAAVALGVWILQDFLPALVWAGVLAIALWPLYRRLLYVMPRHSDRVLAPVIATLLIGIVIIGPLVLLGFAVAHESHFVVRFISEVRHHGIPAPQWIGELPLIGSMLADRWRMYLGDPAMAEELISHIDLHTLTESARQFGGEIVHRLAILAFTLLTLFFVFRDGGQLVEQLRTISDRVIGMRGERVGQQVIAAVHGTVSGLVLVGLAEGILLGVAYFAVGLPYPASVGAVTGVAAVIPFAAPAAYCLAALYLFAAGNTVGAIVVLAVGSAVVFIADHFVRPVLIGGAARLPFLLVLLGILGGLETLGFLGLFVGPAAMAALVALWHEWTEPDPVANAVRAASQPTIVAARSRRARKA